MKPIIRLFVLFVAILMICSSAYSQDNSVITVQSLPSEGDFMAITIKDLPPLITAISSRKDTASYRYFYIYGDGDFNIFSGIRESFHRTNHHYPPVSSLGSQTSGATYIARAYGVGLYSNGKPPPRRLKSLPFSNDPNFTDTTPFENKRIIDAGKFVKLLPHAQAKQGEPLIYVLAIGNPLDSIILSGELFLFFDGEIREKGTKVSAQTTLTSVSKFGKFPINEVLIHNDNTLAVSNLYGSSFPSSASYKHALAFNIDDLAPGEEKHIFLEFMVDSSMFKAFDADKKANLDFTAAFISSDERLTEDSPYFDTKDQSFLGKSDLQSLLASAFSNTSPDSVFTYHSLYDTTDIKSAVELEGNFPSFSGAGRLLGIDNNIITLVKGHDPNFLEAVSCACPRSWNQRNKMIITLHAENDGQGEVNDIYFDMELPEGLTADDIVGTPMRHHPFVDEPGRKSIDYITYKVIDNKHIQWHFTYQAIYPIALYGAGDESTYVEFTFMAFTDAEPSSFDSLLQTCVRFDDINGSPVCTYPVDVVLMESSTGDLTCTSCSDDPNNDWWKNLPWWVLLLMILLLLVLVILLIIRRARR